MSIEIISINGKNKFLNYETFEKSAKEVLGRNCNSAKIFILNNFPVTVSAEMGIDLLLIIAIEYKTGNYYSPKSIKKRKIYFHNQIIPIKIISNLKDCEIKSEFGDLIIDDEHIDYSDEIKSVKFNLARYFEQRCDFSFKKFYIHPLVHIQNDRDIVMDNYLVSSSLDFYSLHKYFSKNQVDIFQSYIPWRKNRGYQMISKDIERIVNQASKDSEIGYLTKKKIDRICKQLSNSKKIYEEINEKLIVVKGKAGTGKSSELLLLTMKCISNSQNTLYLTYNNLLIFDIKKTIDAYSISKHNKKSNIKLGESSVNTLHAFFYRLSKSLGITLVMNEERIESLISLLKERMRNVYDSINKHFQKENIDFDKIKSEIQDNNSFDVGTREVGIDLINFLKRKNVSTVEEFSQESIEFFKNKTEVVKTIAGNEIFLSDYYNVLERTLLAINNPEEYFKKYNKQDKFELLEVALKLKGKHVQKDNDKPLILKKGFTEQKNRSVGGYRRKRTLFIDEAQDCHRYEKEILVSIYGSNNIVVASGGQEQLIRHGDLCNWEVAKSTRLNFKNYFTKNKSYRVKKTVVDFCNFLAQKFQIRLNLEPLESEDEGELLFDFRKQHNETEILKIFNQLNTKSEVNGCTPYESLLVLIESNSQRSSLNIELEQNKETAIINEYENIEESSNLIRGKWKYISSFEEENYSFWDGTIENKSGLTIPSSIESRVIYYESCRGLESWAVACFSLDKFFDKKRKEPNAEKYLLGDLLLSQKNEKRKSMYAATWVLMAITRVIDTLYIQIDDENSELGKIAKEYLTLNNRNVRELI
jgi:hypothetical protein